MCIGVVLYLKTIIPVQFTTDANSDNYNDSNAKWFFIWNEMPVIVTN